MKQCKEKTLSDLRIIYFYFHELTVEGAAEMCAPVAAIERMMADFEQRRKYTDGILLHRSMPIPQDEEY